jgi:hypothetical protein
MMNAQNKFAFLLVLQRTFGMIPLLTGSVPRDAALRPKYRKSTHYVHWWILFQRQLLPLSFMHSRLGSDVNLDHERCF